MIFILQGVNYQILNNVKNVNNERADVLFCSKIPCTRLTDSVRSVAQHSRFAMFVLGLATDERYVEWQNDMSSDIDRSLQVMSNASSAILQNHVH